MRLTLLPGVTVSERALRRAAALLIVLAVAVVYQGTLGCPFIYDDRIWITWNPSIRHLGSLASVLAAPPGPFVHGRPVLSLSLALNYALSGDGAWSYHLFNLLVHALAALTLFGIVRRTLAFLPGLFPTEGGRIFTAFAAALLWAVHPLQTEAVTYVIQRAESLMGLFYLLTLYCFIRGLQPSGRGAWRLLAVAACLLGMGTKEVMVTAPLAVLLYDGIFVAGSLRGALRLRWRIHGALAGTWLALVLLATGLGGRGVGYGLGYTGGSYALAECWAVPHYLLLALWPYPLVFDYGTDLIGGARQALPWACLLAALVGAVFLALRRRPALGFLGAWFLLILAPTSSFVPVAFQPMAEHRMYLSLAAVTAGLAAWAYSALGRRSVPLLLLAAAVLGAGTFLRNRDYRSEIALWRDTVLRRPSNERAYLALASALSVAGRDEEACREFTEALRIEPWDFEAHRGLGLSLYHLGRVDEALKQYRGIATPKPDSAELHYDMGLALDRKGRLDEAIGEFRRALAIDPGYGEVRNNLGGALFRTGRVDEAISQYELALGSTADPALIHFNLGLAIASKGGFERAADQYREAVRLDPGFAEAHNSLGFALAQLGRYPEAIAEFEQALRIRPGYAAAQASLAQLRASRAAPAPPR